MKKSIIVLILIVGFIIPISFVKAYNVEETPILTLPNITFNYSTFNSANKCNEMYENYELNYKTEYPYYFIIGNTYTTQCNMYIFKNKNDVDISFNIYMGNYNAHRVYYKISSTAEFGFYQANLILNMVAPTTIFNVSNSSYSLLELQDNFKSPLKSNIDIKLENFVVSGYTPYLRYNSIKITEKNIIYNQNDVMIKNNKLADGKIVGFEIPEEVEGYDPIFLDEDYEVLIISPKQNDYNSNVYFPTLFFLSSNFYSLDLNGNYTKKWHGSDFEEINFTPRFEKLTFPENELLVIDYKNFDENYIKILPFFIKESDFNFYKSTRDLLLITSNVVDYKGETHFIDISEEIEKVIIEENLQVEPERTIFSSLIEKLESTKTIIHSIYSSFYNSLPQGFQLLHNIILHVFCIIAIRKVVMLR